MAWAEGKGTRQRFIAYIAPVGQSLEAHRRCHSWALTQLLSQLHVVVIIWEWYSKDATGVGKEIIRCTGTDNGSKGPSPPFMHYTCKFYIFLLFSLVNTVKFSSCESGVEQSSQKRKLSISQVEQLLTQRIGWQEDEDMDAHLHVGLWLLLPFFI